MRRTVIIILSLLFMSGVVASVYALYANHTEVIEFDDLTVTDKFLNSNGEFTALFQCDLKGKYISDIQYEVKGRLLLITAYATPTKDNAIKTDEYGYIAAALDVGTDIESIYYYADGDFDYITFGRTDIEE